MRKITYAMMVATTAFAFASCGGNKDAKQSADSLNQTKDTTAMKDSTAKDTTVAKNGAMAVDADDAKFATSAAVGGLTEVAAAKIALEKTADANIKQFASMMVKDHGAANQELMDIAKKKNITLPSMPDADHQKKLDDLSKLTGKDFDKAYVDAMVDGHEKTLSLMQDAAKNCKDADLKAFAAKVAPTVQMHLDAIKKIKSSMK